jgi:hypothetical protein
MMKITTTVVKRDVGGYEIEHKVETFGATQPLYVQGVVSKSFMESEFDVVMKNHGNRIRNAFEQKLKEAV